jgi:hypothetical protein
MKRIYLVMVTLVSAVFLVWLCQMTASQSILLQTGAQNEPLTLNIAFLLCIGFLLGIFFWGALTEWIHFGSKQKLIKLQAQRTQAETHTEVAIDKIAALESKIETLELALQKALQSASKSV